MTEAELADAPSPVLNRKIKSAAKQEARNLAFLVSFKCILYILLTFLQLLSLKFIAS